MKRVLLDENVDSKLKRSFDQAFEVVTVCKHGWSGKKNGDLLHAAEKEFDVFVTCDRSIPHQQTLSKLALAVVLILARSNRRADIEPMMGEVNRAVRSSRAGTLTTVAK